MRWILSLLAALSLALPANTARAEPPRVEAGLVALDRWSVPPFAPMSEGTGERFYDIDVPLRRQWTAPPLVVANLSFVDADNSANLRIQVFVLSVSASSFKLRFRTWADTKIWGAGASWFAIEAPPGSQPTPVQQAPVRAPAKSQVSDADQHRNRLPTREPPRPPECPRDTKFGCMSITSGVAPSRGEEHPVVCGCIPKCPVFVFASQIEGHWPDGSAKGSFRCTNTLPP